MHYEKPASEDKELNHAPSRFCYPVLSDPRFDVLSTKQVVGGEGSCRVTVGAGSVLT